MKKNFFVSIIAVLLRELVKILVGSIKTGSGGPAQIKQIRLVTTIMKTPGLGLKGQLGHFKAVISLALAIAGKEMGEEVANLFVTKQPAGSKKLVSGGPATMPLPVPVEVVKPKAPVRPADAPARTLNPRLAKKLVPAGTSAFSCKLTEVAKEMGLQDHTLLGQFRQMLKESSQKGEYWKGLRDQLKPVLSEGLLKEKSDWKLLIAKMKEHLFFGGKSERMFLEQCPKEGIASLLLEEDGLWNLVETVRKEEGPNESSPYHIAFVIDACVVVGKEAKGLLIDCKHAVNRMRQRGFIPNDHWLVQKVGEMRQSKALVPARNKKPEAPTLPPPSTGAEEAVVDHRLDTLQQVAETTGDLDNLSDAELEALTAPDKPATLDAEFTQEFEGKMLASDPSDAVAIAS